jgi:orotate phosphoribosyltransferase-like protein
MALSECYFANVLSLLSRESTVNKAVTCLKRHKDEFDAIAFRGMSGAALAPILAYLLNKELVIVRKLTSHKRTHAHQRVEGNVEGLRYIIVDDFVFSGATISRTIGAINRYLRGSEPATCVALYLYNDCNFGVDGSQHFYARNTHLPVWNNTQGDHPAHPDFECS